MDSFDFDMTVHSWRQSRSPGNEQRNFWTAEAADRSGSRNLAGIRASAVDELVELLIAAPDRKSLVMHCRALDRVLQWGHYVIPQFHIGADRLVFWNKFGRPETIPSAGVQIDTWWLDIEKAAGERS